MSAKTALSGPARARQRNAQVVGRAGAPGHVLDPGAVPRWSWRTDLVDPVVSFVVYGVPAGQGSKRFAGTRGGKPVLKEQSDYVAPWRKAVGEMASRAVRDHASRTGKPWQAINEPVLVAATVTVPETDAATKRGDVYAQGTPDLDKLQRAIGDAISPTPVAPSEIKGVPEPMKKQARAKIMDARRKTCVLHDDSLIVVWDHVVKVYPKTTPDSLGYSGVTIQVWRISDLERAEALPVGTRDGVTVMQVQDIRQWARPLTRESWNTASQRLWADDPAAVLAAPERVSLTGRGITDEGMRSVCRALALYGPEHRLPVTLLSVT